MSNCSGPAIAKLNILCNKTISSSALSLPASPTAPQTPHPLRNPSDIPRLPASYNTPLALLFNRVLAQVASYQPLLDASKEVSEKFDFFARVFWPEIGDTIVERLGNVIFAAGRPNDLHKVRPLYKIMDASFFLLI